MAGPNGPSPSPAPESPAAAPNTRAARAAARATAAAAKLPPPASRKRSAAPAAEEPRVVKKPKTARSSPIQLADVDGLEERSAPCLRCVRSAVSGKGLLGRCFDVGRKNVKRCAQCARGNHECLDLPVYMNPLARQLIISASGGSKPDQSLWDDCRKALKTVDYLLTNHAEVFDGVKVTVVEQQPEVDKAPLRKAPLSNEERRAKALELLETLMP